MRNLMLTMVLLFPMAMRAQLSSEEAAKANNPLANAKALNIQNYYLPSIYDDADIKANSLLVRYAMPFAGGKVLMRFTLPVTTTVSGYSNGKPTYTSGLGDLNFFATYTLSKPASKTLIGLGPQVVIPTATNNFTGAGKWQVGGAFVIFNTGNPALQYGGLITYQTSIAGQEDRPSTSLLAAQPFGIFQLGKGAYLRSTATWNFDLKNERYIIPVGIGAGHVLKAGGAVFNIFLEPQFTVWHKGSGQAVTQIFGGINCQF